MIRKTPFLLLLFMSSFHCLWAQSQGAVMQVTLTNGTKNNYTVAERPVVTVDQQSVTVANKGNTTMYALNDVKNYTFSSVSSSGTEYIQFADGQALPLSRVKSITSSIQSHPGTLSALLKNDQSISLFVSALEATGMIDSLKTYEDTSYSVGADSVGWNNDQLCIYVAVEYDNVAYMEHRYIKHTVFAEPNTVFAKYGVKTLNDLKQLAAKIYDPKYPEDAGVTNLKDRRNSLNRFVSYHLLPFQGEYYNLTHVDGPNSALARLFDRKRLDIADWYETMMPYSIMKFSYPSGSEMGLYINRRGIQTRADYYGYKYRGAKITPPEEMTVNQTAVNGVYHYIDDIISYGVQPDGTDIQNYVFSERMRLDATTLSPDFMTSGARGHYTRSDIEGGKYGRGGQGAVAANNVNTCLGFKSGSAANWTFTDDTHVHVRNRVLNFWSYGGDEVAIKGNFDMTVKLPPLPEGNYELRLATVIGMNKRGIIAFFIDDEFIDMVDMRPGGSDPKIGWRSDASLGSEEMISYFDHAFHNKGRMKGPKSYNAGSDDGNVYYSNFRDTDGTLRKVVGIFHSDGKSDHYLRLIQTMEGDDYELPLDYIELVPEAVYDNPDVNEDIW